VNVFLFRLLADWPSSDQSAIRFSVCHFLRYRHRSVRQRQGLVR